MKKYKDLVTKLENEEITEIERMAFVAEKSRYEKELNPIREEFNRDKWLGSYSSFVVHEVCVSCLLNVYLPFILWLYG